MSRNKKKIIRTVTVPQSIGFFREVMCRMEKMAVRRFNDNDNDGEDGLRIGSGDESGKTTG